MLLVVDQLVRNGDRNLGNIVFVSQHGIQAIDQGEILGGSSLQLADLYAATPWAEMKPLFGQALNTLPLALQTALAGTLTQVLSRFYALQPELRAICHVAENADSHAALDAIWWRSLDLPTWFAKRLELLLA